MEGKTTQYKNGISCYHNSTALGRGCLNTEKAFQNVRFYKRILTLVFTFALVYTSHSQTLDDYVERATENNPALLSSFNQYKASLEKVNQVGSLDNPQLTVGIFIRPMELLMGNQRGEISLMQMFPWFGMLKTQKDEATLMAEARYEVFREERNQMLYQIKETYYQLHQLQNTIEITEANLEILKTLEELSIIRYQGGNTSGAVSAINEAVKRPVRSTSASTDQDAMGMGGGGSNMSAPASGSGSSSGMSSMGGGTSGGKLTDVLRIQVQIIALESDLEQLRIDKNPLIARFNQLLGSEPVSEIALDTTFYDRDMMGTEEVLLDAVLDNNPMLRMLDKESEVYRTQGEMAKLEGRPMIGAGVNYMLFSARPESMAGGPHGDAGFPAGPGGHMVMPMVTLSLPIYRKQYKALAAEAGYWRESTALQRQDLENKLAYEFESIRTSLRDIDRKLVLLDQQVELMEQTMDLAVTSYANEGSTLEEILSIQRELLDYRLGKLNARVDRELALAKLDLLIGI